MAVRAEGYDVCGIGNAIVDVIGESEPTLLTDLGLQKGAMTLIDEEAAETLTAALPHAARSSGGSVANSMAGLASLGGSAAFIGKVRDDALGRAFRDEIQSIGVDFPTAPAVDGPSTARCLIFVTPDADRTMQTYLGASTGLAPDDVDPDYVKASAITCLEGYLFDPPQAKAAFVRAAEIAHAAGRRVALSLSDRFCVDRHRDSFAHLVAGHVDLLFANEDEILALYQVESFDQALQAVRGNCEIAILTRGAKGSVVVTEKDVHVVDAAPVAQVVDTTGAGDLFAAGFLHGYVLGRDLGDCARIGGMAAGEVIGHFGARPHVLLKELLREQFG